MGKPILYGAYVNPPVRSVLLVANAIGLDLEFKEVSLQRGDHLTEEYIKKNPQHTVPTLEDNGKIIWDSHAIATYLITTYGKGYSSLYPSDPYTRARIDQRLHFDTGILYSKLRECFIRAVRLNQPIDQETKDSVVSSYEFMEKFLVSDPYLVGDKITVADLCCITSVASLNLMIPIDSQKFPKLTAWTKRIEQLPYYEKANKAGIEQIKQLIAGKV